MRKETRDIWIATDGTEFTTQAACEDYETGLCFNEMLRQEFFNADLNASGLFTYREFKRCVETNQDVVAAMLTATGNWKCKPIHGR